MAISHLMVPRWYQRGQQQTRNDSGFDWPKFAAEILPVRVSRRLLNRAGGAVEHEARLAAARLGGSQLVGIDRDIAQR